MAEDAQAKAARLVRLLERVVNQPFAEHCWACGAALDMNTGEAYHHHAGDCPADAIDALMADLRGEEPDRSPLDNHPRGDGSGHGG